MSPSPPVGSTMLREKVSQALSQSEVLAAVHEFLAALDSAYSARDTAVRAERDRDALWWWSGTQRPRF